MIHGHGRSRRRMDVLLRTLCTPPRVWRRTTTVPTSRTWQTIAPRLRALLDHPTRRRGPSDAPSAARSSTTWPHARARDSDVLFTTTP